MTRHIRGPFRRSWTGLPTDSLSMTRWSLLAVPAVLPRRVGG